MLPILSTQIFRDEIMIDTTTLEAFYGPIFTANKHILDMPAIEMIAYLQMQFNHFENGTEFSDKIKLKNEFKLLTDESEETRKDGLAPKNLTMIRDGIADQLTIAYFLAFKVNGFKYEPVELNLSAPKSYTEYCERTEATIQGLKAACFETNDIADANFLLNRLIAQLYTVPEFSAFNVDFDLIDITFSSLSKVCTATEDLTAEQVAEKTLSAYQERGYKAEIQKTSAGYGIFVTEDCEVNDKTIPKGKFLKSLFLLEPVLADVKEETVW